MGWPCLEIRRRETDFFYLDQQLRALRRHAPEPLEVRMDMLPQTGKSLYGTVRLRVRSKALLPLYNLLYPQDMYQVSRQVLEIAGLRGLRDFWLDCGAFEGSNAVFRNAVWGQRSWENLVQHLRDIDQFAWGTTYREGGPVFNGVCLDDDEEDGYPALLTDLYPLTHPRLRERLLRPRDRELRRRGGRGSRSRAVAVRKMLAKKSLSLDPAP